MSKCAYVDAANVIYNYICGEYSKCNVNQLILIEF